jgi:hypothetical protein
MMKVSLKLLAAAGLLATVSSCSSFLDINSVNPNALTGASVTPDVALAQALTVTAGNYTGNNPSFNSYASWAAGYWGKSGVVSGYGEEITYNYSTNWATTQSLFNNVYDNLEDYQFIVNQAANYPNHGAIARIMKVYNFLLLVDEYGDIPYSQALQGSANITPTYDKAADIYKDFIVQLDAAISTINSSKSARTVGTEDIVFGGGSAGMTQWKQFANSLKLRILMRESQTGDAALNSYVKTQLATVQASTEGFITTDVVVQPGYATVAGQQNPFYNRYGYTAAGAAATERTYQIPTQYILDQYSNNNDPRLTNFYTQGSRAGVAGYVGAKPGENTSPSTSGNIVASFHQGADKATPVPPKGFFKGPNAPTILMMNAELLFLKAEAETRGLFTGGETAAQADYQNGIIAAFQTAYSTGATVPQPVPAAPATSTATGLPEYNQYIAANTANPLVAYDKATASGTLGKQAVILYQKYLAMNLLGSTEAWDDYRRAAQPKLNASGTKDGYPVSIQSSSPRPDNLPTRVLYPQTEYSTNAVNVAATGSPNQFTKIFWDSVD